MKTHHEYRIMCYGDSNTWGTISKWQETSAPSCRFGPEHRWPCVLQAALEQGFSVIDTTYKH